MANLTLYNVGICSIVALGGFTYGFGFAGFLTSIGQPQFYDYFNLDPISTYTANILGAVNALFAFGAAVGAITQGWTADWLGRRNALALAAFCALVGGALAAGSVAIEMLIIVRILQGVGLGMLICLVSLYTAEVAPAHARGMISAMTVIGIGLGYTSCSIVSIGTFFSTNAAVTWRLPLALGCVGPLALLFGLLFVPESPRYLVWVNKNDEAWKVIQRLHHDRDDPTESFARAEFIQIVQQVGFDREQKSGYIQMFTVPSWRRRSVLVIFLFFATQSTGILGIANFIVLIFGGLGMTPLMSFVLYTVYSIVGTGAIFFSAALVDKVGRKRMLLIGFPLAAACLLTEAMLQMKYLGTDNKAGNAACLLVIFVYICVYQIIDVPSFALASEIFPTSIRAKGLGLTFFAYFVGAITYTTPAALAFKNIKWGMYLIWAALCLISTLIVYFFVPETKQMPMEEIGAMFGDEVIVHLTSDGHGIVERHKINLDMLGEVENVVGDGREKNGTNIHNQPSCRTEGGVDA